MKERRGSKVGVEMKRRNSKYNEEDRHHKLDSLWLFPSCPLTLMPQLR